MWYTIYGIEYMALVYGLWYILLEVQGSYNQATTVGANNLEAPSVELARSYLGYTYSYGLVITWLGLQAQEYLRGPESKTLGIRASLLGLGYRTRVPNLSPVEALGNTWGIHTSVASGAVSRNLLVATSFGAPIQKYFMNIPVLVG